MRRDSAWKAGLREAPLERWAPGGRFLCRLCVTLRKKPGTPLGVGKRLVLGVGLASPLLFLPLGQGWTEGRGGKMGVSALPVPPPSPPGTWGLITSQKGSQLPQHQWAVKETPRGLSRLDLRVPELCPVRRGWGGSCPLATPRRGVQGQDEALHRFWRELALVELWGPRPRVPPYPGPRDIKGERGGKVGRGRAFPRGLRPFGRGFCNPAQPKLGMGRDH
jgi:hypothetical protein